MNIIKFKDTIIPDNDFYNKNLKGKYAFWIHMKYAVPFFKYEIKTEKKEPIYIPIKAYEYSDYVNFEENGLSEEEKEQCLDTTTISLEQREAIINITETSLLNDFSFYKNQNEYVIDTKIPEDELKKFRTWLAYSLLDLNEYLDDKVKLSPNEVHVLQYYSPKFMDTIVSPNYEGADSGMNDEVTKQLGPDYFGNPLIEYQQEPSGCGCCGDTNLSSLYNTTISTCDPLYIYRKNIYNKMIAMFSDINFWLKFGTTFIKDFKLYIEEIIALKLPLTESTFTTTFIDCGCRPTPIQNYNENILDSLVNALNDIISNNIEGNKLKIHDALYDWSSLLYEQMYWA